MILKSTANGPREGECAPTRAALQDALDGAPLAAESHEHVRACAACRAFRDDLNDVRETLRRLPSVPFPGERLEAIWRDTLDAQDGVAGAPLPRRGSPLRPFVPPSLRPSLLSTRRLGAALAASIVLGLAWWSQPASPPAPGTGPGPGLSEPDLARLDRDVEAVLLLVSDALRRTEHLAVDDVLSDRTAPAMNVLPVR